MSEQRFEEQKGPLKNSDAPARKEKEQEAARPEENTEGQTKKVNAEQIDSIISSPTDAVRSRHPSGRDMGNTGTNISYEGATAPGGGGSAGTGEGSGQPATDSGITVPDPEEAAAAGSNHPYNDKRDAEDEPQPEKEGRGEAPDHRDHDDDPGRETLGTP